MLYEPEPDDEDEDDWWPEDVPDWEIPELI